MRRRALAHIRGNAATNSMNRICRRLLIGLAAHSLLATAPCGALAQATLSTVINSGPSTNRVDIVFIGDGYVQSELNSGLYLQHITSYMNDLLGSGAVLNDPFSRYEKFFNVHAISVASVNSGSDKPFVGWFVNTALDATFSNEASSRSLYINETKASQFAVEALAGTPITLDMRFAVVNEDRYGGAGGRWATFAGQNGNAHEIATHEVAHSFSNLADEYFYTSDPYTGSEPTEPNVTTNPYGAKWSHWLGFDDPRDPELDVGVFEGGKYAATGIYRPSDSSKMRVLNAPFNAVGREALILDFYDFVRPLDGWRPNGSTVVDQPLWVDVVDPEVHSVRWYVDGALIAGATGETFDAQAFGVAPGVHSVRASSYDTVLDHVGDGGMLDLVRKNLDRLEQSVTWTLSLSAAAIPGDFDGDRDVDGADLIRWRDGFGITDNAVPAMGDADGDHDVDGADVLVWQRRLGTQPSSIVVPEPRLGAYCGALTAVVVSASRRRKPERYFEA